MNIFLAIALVFGTAAAAPSANYGHIAAIDSYSIPRYEFNYAVNDPVTGDNKAQSEAREGGVVKGSYSLAESDGTLRVVEYTADDIHGFNAKVKRIGAAAHPQQLFTPVVKQIVQPIAAPVYEPIAEPIYRPIAPPGAVAHPQQLFTPAVNKVVQPIAAPVYEPIAEPIYRPIAPPIYKNLAPVSFSYSISNLNNLGGYGGYEKNLDLGLDLGFGGWNMGRLGLDHGGWIH